MRRPTHTGHRSKQIVTQADVRQRRRPRHVVNIRYLVGIKQETRDWRLTQPCNWHAANNVKEFSVADETAWEVQATAGVAQLRRDCIDDEAEALLAALQLLSRSFYFPRRRRS